MRTCLILALLTIVSVACFGCACAPGVAVAPAQAAPLASPCYAPAAAPCAQAAPQVVLAQPTGATYSVGAAENARAVLGIPGGVVECAGTALGEGVQVIGRFLRCAGNSLVPTPTPTLRYTYAPAVAPAQAGCVVDEQVTEMVPETRMVPRTRTVRRIVPQAQPGCEPVSCKDGCCDVVTLATPSAETP